MIKLIEIREISRVSENLSFRCSEEIANYCMREPLGACCLRHLDN